ncbi:MAG: xylosidase [Proteobacteria bacterium]|nr:xylosidase [Pseudomonadota bacterium]
MAARRETVSSGPQVGIVKCRTFPASDCCVWPRLLPRLARATIAVALAVLSGLCAPDLPLEAAPSGEGASQVDQPLLVRERPRTWCNPIDLDYAFAPRRDAPGENTAHRSTADPACVRAQGTFVLVSTNQEGYWLSDDLLTWRFVAHAFKPNGSNDQVCAPGLWATSKGVLLLPSFGEADVMPLYLTNDLAGGAWREAVSDFPVKTWDPSLFQDHDGRTYLYWGSSNLYPIRGTELDQHALRPIGSPVDLIRLSPGLHGWEQFGEDNQNGQMRPFIEGAWMNRFGDRYYLQYGAPGTEWNIYGDGVYVGDHPLGPFVYQEHNPFSWKPTGFIRGAGHGCTFTDVHGNVWHMATMVVSVKHKFERRLGLFPAGVDADGVLFCDTAFGDYPHRMPRAAHDPHGTFTGWMLLSYRKQASASASASGHDARLAFDEDVKTCWSAPDASAGQWLSVDLGGPRFVNAVQVNFAEEHAAAYGKQRGARHRYRVERSDDGRAWRPLIDRSKSERESPHAYTELTTSVRTRFLRVVNVEMPTGRFAISDLRVFGRAAGSQPSPVCGLQVTRDASDRRSATLAWQAVDGAYAYEVAMGIAPDKLYTSFLVYGDTKYTLHALGLRSRYWFRVRAVGESGLSETGQVVRAD